MSSENSIFTNLFAFSACNSSTFSSSVLLYAMIFLFLAAVMPCSLAFDSLFGDLEGSPFETTPSSDFLGNSVFSDPSTDNLVTSAFITSNDEFVALDDSATSADLFSISPDMDDTSASLYLSSADMFDDADGTSDLFVSSNAGDSDFASSDLLLSSDLFNPSISWSDLNVIPQGATDPGVTMDYGAMQLAEANEVAFPELRGALEELRKINENPQGSSRLCPRPATRPARAKCPPGKFPFCCTEGPPRSPFKQDRRGLCFPCGFASFRFVKERPVGYWK